MTAAAAGTGTGTLAERFHATVAGANGRHHRPFRHTVTPADARIVGQAPDGEMRALGGAGAVAGGRGQAVQAERLKVDWCALCRNSGYGVAKDRGHRPSSPKVSREPTDARSIPAACQVVPQ